MRRVEKSSAGTEAGQLAENGNPQSGKSIALHQVVLALALAVTALAYSGTLGFQFVYDDRPQVVENLFVRSWRFAPRYFTEHVWGSILPGFLGNYYRPIFLLWLRTNDMLFGLRPWGWHLTSILAHLGVTLLVYLLASRILGDRLSGSVAALIFGVHPAHIEAVAWVSGVTEPLLGLLFIASFLCYLKARERGDRAVVWLAASLLLYFAAMLAKETGLVLPMLIFTYEWVFWPATPEGASQGVRGQRTRTALRRVVPYLALIPFYLLARANALKGLSHTLTPLPLSTVVFTWPSLLWLYLKLLVWPVRLSPCYETPYITNPDFVKFVLPAAAVAGSAFILWSWVRRPVDGPDLHSGGSKGRAVAFASAWLLLPIVPLLNLSVLPKGDIAHDRYLYLPSVGFAMIAALALRGVQTGPHKLFGQPAAQVVGVGALAVLLAFGTAIQSLVWADDLLLYYRGLTLAPGNIYIGTNLANIMGEREYYDGAINLYKEILAREPGYWSANYNLGYTYYKVGKLQEAEGYLKRAIQIDPGKTNEFLYLGLTALKLGRLEEASKAIRRAIRISPEDKGQHFALGMVLKLQGDLAGALLEFTAELALDPGQQAARQQIAQVQTRLHYSRSEDSPSQRLHSPRSWPDH